MAKTQYIYLGNQYLCEADESGTLTKRYVNEPGTYTNLVSQKDLTTGETSYPLYDALGSTRAVTDESGDVTDTFVYDAWGNVLDRTGTTELPFQYVGRHGYYHDAETGLSYVMARIYDPRIIRWLSVDPAMFVDSICRYQYVRNTPTSFVDSFGQFTVKDHWQMTLSAVSSSLSSTILSPECQAFVRQVILCCNLSQDLVNHNFNQPERHYTSTPRPQGIGREGNGEFWDARYSAYIDNELREFRNTYPEDCCGALSIIGRLSHSWQDFYGHAVRKDQGGVVNDEGGSEKSDYPGFSAFDDPIDPVIGDPDQRGPFLPATYPGEHPFLREPLIYKGREYNARYTAAENYTKAKLQPLLKLWEIECWTKCCCIPCSLDSSLALLSGAPQDCPRLL